MLDKEGPVFSEKETAYIFQGQAQNKGSQHALQKLESLDIVRYLPVLGRNLRVLQERFWTNP
jgi:hypothetical protein